MDFSGKLNIITGETGAGKSILLGALGLIMGKRAESKALYDATKKCIVEAYFDIQHYDLKGFFEENDLDYDTEITIRREITPSGKSRSFINDTPSRLDTLRKLSQKLVDVHQQFDSLDIYNEAFQLNVLDALASNQKPLKVYKELYKKYNANQQKLQKLLAENRRAMQEMDFLEFQVNELTEAELEDGEQEALEQEIDTLNNAENIKRNLGAAYQQLSDNEQSLVSQLTDISRTINEVSKFHPKIPKLLERYDGLILELQEVVIEFEEVADSTEHDGERIDEIQVRLDEIYRLQSKHHVNEVKDLLDIQEGFQNKIDAFGDLSSDIEALEIVISKQEKELKQKALKLSKKRKSVIASFEKNIHKSLALLSMQHARINVELKTLDKLNSTGLDHVAFMFSANKGGTLDLIKNVASGGEISRLALCVKTLIADAITLPTLIFDEIDTGVSGDVALKMGDILRDLANKHQVMSITHTPQIAAKADHHYFVYKEVKGDSTVSNVKLLNDKECIAEIATMLSGKPPTTNALNNAQELLAL